MRNPKERAVHGRAYQELRNKVIDLQGQYNNLSQDLNDKNGRWVDQKYRHFFWRCRKELQELYFPLYKHAPNKELSADDELLDLLIQLYYTDEALMQSTATNRKILWQSFEKGMLERVKASVKTVGQSEKAATSGVVEKRQKRKQRQNTEKVLSNKFGFDKPVPIYTETVKEIKRIIRDTPTRRILAALDVLSRRGTGQKREPVVFKAGSRTELTKRTFCDTLEISWRQIDRYYETLSNVGAITTTEDDNTLSITVRLGEVGGVVCGEVDTAENLRKAIKKCISARK